MTNKNVKEPKYLDATQLKEMLGDERIPLLCVESKGRLELVNGADEKFHLHKDKIKAKFDLIQPGDLGNKEFMKTYGTKYAYYGGAMANGISSVQMLISLGKRGFMGSLGTGGMSLEKIEQCIDKVQCELGNRSFLVNLLSSPAMPEREMKTVELYLRKNIRAIEASAFINMSKALVYYRIAGIEEKPDGRIELRNHIIAKISREEVAMKFMSPPPDDLVGALLKEGKITERQAELAKKISMADDITVEADSGGHTDNRPLVSLFPAIVSMYNKACSSLPYEYRIRFGAGGGIGTPESAMAAFMMGADYIVTGSINQSCVEAGTSEHVKKVLEGVHMQDVVMSPCADMFELGAKVQVIKKGTMFPMNAQKLYQIYCQCSGINDIPEKQRITIEKRLFHKSLDEIWSQTEKYFEVIDPMQNVRAKSDEKYKMALVFRWYLGQSSKWAVEGNQEHYMDMQIWCGQSMGAFNNYVKGTKFEKVENRKVAEVAELIMYGAAYLINVQTAALQGVDISLLKKFPV